MKDSSLKLTIEIRVQDIVHHTDSGGVLVLCVDWTVLMVAGDSCRTQ